MHHIQWTCSLNGNTCLNHSPPQWCKPFIALTSLSSTQRALAVSPVTRLGLWWWPAWLWISARVSSTWGRGSSVHRLQKAVGCGFAKTMQLFIPPTMHICFTDIKFKSCSSVSVPFCNRTFQCQIRVSIPTATTVHLPRLLWWRYEQLWLSFGNISNCNSAEFSRRHLIPKDVGRWKMCALESVKYGFPLFTPAPHLHVSSRPAVITKMKTKN